MAAGGYEGDYGHQNGGLDHTAAAGGSGDGSAVFISNLQWWTTDAELEQLCAAYGHVLTIRFIDDKTCGKSRGMAIVEFAEGDAAAQCIAGLHGRDLNGRPCRVSHQQQRNQAGASTSGQYGGGRGMGSSLVGSGGGGGRGPPPPGGRGGRGGMAGRGGRGGGGGGGGPPSMEELPPNPAAMMGGGGMMMMPGMMPGMMGMGMPTMEMMQSMMMMPGMMPFGMPGMTGFKPPPPPGGPPKKE